MISRLEHTARIRAGALSRPAASFGCRQTVKRIIRIDSLATALVQVRGQEPHKTFLTLPFPNVRLPWIFWTRILLI